jgi:autoinducer 2 (AI-2) kinase
MINAVEDLVVWDKEYFPNSENFGKYSEIKEKWQEVYENQLSLVDRGLTESMWKAPGV